MRGRTPQRSCVACRRSRPKQELLRVVRTPEGEIKADLAGKLAGRGAYICPTQECLRAAHKQKKLERALGKHIEEALLVEIAAVVDKFGLL